jgi:ribosome-associated toxin RatA of RatAB toxin-antitoxin module
MGLRLRRIETAIWTTGVCVGNDTGRHSQLIAAPAERIRRILLDFAAYPNWQAGVSECRVLESAAGQWTVETVVDIKLSRVHYVARYRVEDGEDAEWNTLRWDYVRGDLKDLRGRYTLAPQGTGSTVATLVTVDIAFELGFFLPGPIKNTIRDGSVRSSLQSLQKVAESAN